MTEIANDNPFKFGRIVSNEAFCNRKEEISSLKSYILDSNSVWLYSPRRYGKSSLVKQVFQDIKGVETIYFDLYNVSSIDDFCKRYASLLAEELFDWKDSIKQISERLTSYFKGLKPSVSFNEEGGPSFSLQTGKVDKQSDVDTILNVPYEISKRTGKKICVAFDEFQEINRIEPFLINWMRSNFQLHDTVSYIFLGSKQSLMQSIFSSYNSPFYEFGVKMNIEPIDRAELSDFIIRRFSSANIEIKPSIVDYILDISAGHPHFTQFFASEVFYQIKAGYDQEEETFNSAWLSRVIESQSHIFQNIFDRLSNIQRKVLLAIAIKNEGEELFSGQSRERYELPVSSSLTSALNSLQKKDLISKENSAYLILNPVFKQWLHTLNNPFILQ